MNYYPFYWGRALQLKECFRAILRGFADEQSLLIMDILVELADTSLANVEVQKNRIQLSGTEKCLLFLGFTAQTV